MLRKQFRLTLNKEIQNVLKNGRYFSTHFFNLKIINNQLPENRFCVIISKKISKFATKRNRIKRQLSEVLRLNLLKIKPGHDIVMIVKNNIIDPKTKLISPTYQELEQELITILKKLRLIQN